MPRVVHFRTAKSIAVVLCLGFIIAASSSKVLFAADEAQHAVLTPTGVQDTVEDTWLADFEALQRPDASVPLTIDVPEGMPSSADELRHPAFLAEMARQECAKAEEFGTVADASGARTCYGRALVLSNAALTAGDPDSPAQAEAAEVFGETCRALGEPTFASAAAGIEEHLADAEPSFASWAGHYALADYYLHEGANQAAADEHLLAVVQLAELGFVDAAVATKSSEDEMRARLVWIRGFAEYELGMYDSALSRFQRVLSEFPGGGEYVERAAFAVPAALCRLSPDEPETHAAAYEQFLADNPASPYALWAMVELASAYAALGLNSDAQALYENVLQSSQGSDVAEAAYQGLLSVIEEEPVDQTTATKPLPAS